VGVHGQTHGAAGGAPLETGRLQDAVYAAALALALDAFGTGYGDGLDARMHAAPPEEPGYLNEVGQAGDGARAQEGHVDLGAGHGPAALEPHGGQGLVDGRALVRRHGVGRGYWSVDRHGLAGDEAPRDRGRHVLGPERHDVVVIAVGVGAVG